MMEVFTGLLNRSITAAWLVIFVIAVRALVKNMPQWCRFVLWGTVALLLFLPFTPRSFIMMPTEGNTIWRTVCLFSVVLWIVGMIGLLGHDITKYVRLKYHYRMAISYDEKVYYDDNVEIPFVLGAMEPHLYLPKNLSEEEEQEIIEKEKYRISHGVYLWKVLGGILRSVYWFQPAVWIGCHIFLRDLEQVGMRKERISVLHHVLAILLCIATLTLSAWGLPAEKDGWKNPGGSEQANDETSSDNEEPESWVYMHPRTGLTITLDENGYARISDMASSILPNGVSGMYSRKKNILTITSSDGGKEYHFLMDGYNLIFYKYISSDISTVTRRVRDIEDEAYFEPTFDAVQGVYYPGLNNPEMYYNSMAIGAGYLFGDLYYQDQVYKEKELYRSENKADLPMEELLGEEIGPVYGNSMGKWSYRSDLIGDFFVGTLYQVKGYGESFRVAIYYEEKEILYEQVQVGNDIYTGKSIGTGQTQYYCIKIVDCLNDIWLYHGEELFKDRMHLEDSVGVSRFADAKDELLIEFYETLNQATFVDEDEESLPDFAEETGKEFLFEDRFGLLVRLMIYESGYVIHEADGNTFIAKVDPEICKRVIDKAK